MAEEKTAPGPLEVVAVKEEKELLSWRALGRPYQKKDRDFWVTALASVGLVCLILFFVGEWGLIAALLALVFLYYVLTTVKPEETNYRISTKGVYLPGAKERISWDFLKSYYFSQRWGHQLLKIETFINSFPLISLVIQGKDKKKIEAIMKKYLPQGEEKQNAADKISQWILKRLPLEIEKSKETSAKKKK